MQKVSGKNRIFGLAAAVIFATAVIILIGIFQVRNTYTSQIVNILGVVSDGEEFSRGKLNTVMSGSFNSGNFDRGLRLLEEYGYSKSGVSLMSMQIRHIWIFMGTALAAVGVLLIWGLTLIYRSQQRFLGAMSDWVRDLDDKKLEARVRETSTAEDRELVCALQEHRRLDIRKQNCLDMEKKKTVAFVEDVSHQLKTPLTIMRMHIEKMNYAQEFSRSSLKKAMMQVDKMVLLISMMMKVGMLNSGKTKMEMHSHKVWIMAEEIAQEFETICELKQVRLRSEVKGQTGFYYDDYWMKEAVENIVKNSIEYSLPDSEIHIKYQVGTSGLNIFVKDHGRGIEEENLEHIFDRFTSSFRQNDSSSGLGLAITKQVIEAHFGKITVENNPDGGVTFSIYLPVLHGADVYEEGCMEEVS